MEPSSPYKQSIGLFLLAVGYLVIAFGVNGIDPSTKLSMGWLVSLYTIHTFGELCLSPIGLSMVNKLAPVKLASLLMGVWFLSTASANKFAGTLSALYPEEVKIVKSYHPKVTAVAMAEFKAYLLDTNVWNADPKGKYALNLANIKTVKIQTKDDKKDSLVSIVADSSKTANISVYHLKVIKSNNKYFDRAFLLNDSILITHDSVDVVNKINGKKVASKEERFQTWNLKPQKPTFLGVVIDSLFSFFMLFVIMAGLASVILFFISKKLVKMMNGVM